MKKRLITMVLLLLTLVLALSLCACGDDKKRDEDDSLLDASDDCEHRWIIESQRAATCDADGEKILKCSHCNEKKTIAVPKLDCDYSASWEWYNDDSAVAIYLKCPYTSEHNYSFNARISKENRAAATCQNYGIIVHHAEATYKGKTYTTEKIETTAKRMCSIDILHPNITPADTCLGETKYIFNCTWCGKVMDEYSRYEHTEKTEAERYDLADYGYCGGSVAIYRCECGETESINIEYRCKTESLEASRTSFVDEDGVEHVTQIKSCSECGLVLEEKWGDRFSPCMDTTYHTLGLKVNEELSFEKKIVDYNPHPRKHTSIEINSYCGCEDLSILTDYIEITEACACGLYKETVSLDWDQLRFHGASFMGAVISSTYTEVGIDAFMPSGVIAFKEGKAYAYDCGLLVFDGYLVVSTEVGDCIYKFTTVRHNDTVIYQKKGEVYILVDDSPTDKYFHFKSRCALEEEKQVIEERLKEIFPNEEFEIPIGFTVPVIPEEPDEPDEPITPSELTDEEKQLIINFLRIF